MLEGRPPNAEALSNDRQKPRSRRRRSRPRRLWPQRDIDRRDRNAGSYGDAGRICGRPTAEGRPRRRLPPYDDPDRGADRDAAIARRRSSLGFVQHLFDAGSRRRCDCGGRHAGLRDQGREPEGLLGLHPPHFRMERRRFPQHDPRRRRRRHRANSSRLSRRGGRHCVPEQCRQRGGGSPLRRDQEPPEEPSRLVWPKRRRDPRRDRGNHDGRTSPLHHGQRRQAALARDQRQRQRHQIEVRQSLWLPGIPGGRDPARHRRDDGREGRHGRGLRRCRQGFRCIFTQRRLPGHGFGGRSDLRVAGGDGGLRSHDHGRRVRARRYFRHRDRQHRRDHSRPHAKDARPGDRLQHRSFRFRRSRSRACAT